MGIHSGSVTVTRYRLLASDARRRTSGFKLTELNELLIPWQAGPVSITNNSAAAIARGNDEDETHPQRTELFFGWDRPAGVEMDATAGEESRGDEWDTPWDMSHCQIDSGFILRIRLESRRVPSALLQILFKQKIAEKSARTGKAVSRQEKARIKTELKEKLTARALPSLSYIDLFWHEAEQEVLVFTASKRALGVFEELFHKTFASELKLSLVKLDPPLTAFGADDWQDSGAAIKKINKFTVAVPEALI